MNLRQVTGTPQPAIPAERAVNPGADAAAARVGTPAAVPAPAASLRVSDVAAGSLAAAVSLADQDPSDAELISTLKARIAAGEFQIDYDGLARALVEDALQSIGKRR